MRSRPLLTVVGVDCGSPHGLALATSRSCRDSCGSSAAGGKQRRIGVRADRAFPAHARHKDGFAPTCGWDCIWRMQVGLPGVVAACPQRRSALFNADTDRGGFGSCSGRLRAGTGGGRDRPHPLRPSSKCYRHPRARKVRTSLRSTSRNSSSPVRKRERETHCVRRPRRPPLRGRPHPTRNGDRPSSRLDGDVRSPTLGVSSSALSAFPASNAKCVVIQLGAARAPTSDAAAIVIAQERSRASAIRTGRRHAALRESLRASALLAVPARRDRRPGWVHRPSS